MKLKSNYVNRYHGGGKIHTYRCMYILHLSKTEPSWWEKTKLIAIYENNCKDLLAFIYFKSYTYFGKFIE